jgi:hypothetical protein
MPASIRRGLLTAVSVFVLTISFTPIVHAQQTAALAANPELAAMGVWDPTKTYAKDDIVTARGSAWISRKPDNVNKVPGQTNPSSAAWWQLFARGFNPTGAWSSATTYQPDDLVTHNGQTYRAKLTGNNKPVTNTTYWELLVTKGANGANGATGPQGPPGPNTGIGTGSQSVPSISFNGDPNTGIYSPEAGKIALVEDGALFLHNQGIENTALGLNALANNDPSGGLDNTAVGSQALASNTTGDGNTAVGRSALGSNTTATNNTAVGVSALSSNTTGGPNSAMGHRALFSNTTGSFNSAMGHRALFSNTTGSSNTAVGLDALFNNTTGVWNSAMGVNALVSNTTGAANSAMGLHVLHNNTTGGNNTAMGAGALSSNDTGSSNTAVGYEALLSNTTGINNSAVGRGALNANTTGSSNIALGKDAGSLPTAPANSIFIGNTGMAGDTTIIKIGTEGTQTTAFMAGIAGATVANATDVMIDVTTGQLGTVSSSRRYKHDIDTMADVSAMLAKLRPVTFRYNKAQDNDAHPLQYGLIAEEVADVFPDLAVFKDGAPETVKYHLLPSFLLAGYQAQQKTITAQTDEIAELKRRLAAIEALLPGMTKAAAR